MQFNTVASAGMKILNELERFPADISPLDSAVPKQPLNAAVQMMNEGVGILLRVIYPIIPHITTRLWSDLGFEKTYGNMVDAPWPQPDATALVRGEIEIVLQVNGKLRGRISVSPDTREEKLRELAIADETVARYVAGKPVKKIIVVPG